MKEKYLPIGTVVLLKGGKKRAMTTGFCSVAQENQDKIYDYSGCVYPEGYLSSNQVCLFDHDQIEEIFFVGFEDEEEKAFKEKLNTIVSNLEKEKAEDTAVAEAPAEPAPAPAVEEPVVAPVESLETLEEPVATPVATPAESTEEVQPIGGIGNLEGEVLGEDSEIKPFGE